MGPTTIEWRITGKCNERCPYCYGPEKHVAAPDATVLKISKLLANSGADYIRFSGGEPLLVPNIKDVFQILKNAGKRIVLSTNGVTFVEKREWLDDLIDKVNISIDGPSASIHQANGRSALGFEVAEACLLDLKKRPPSYPVKVGTVITTKNAFEPNLIKRFYEFLKCYKINEWKIYQYIPEGPIVDSNLQVDDGYFQSLCEEFELEYSEPEFEVLFASASDRLSAYFIVQPYGNVIIPVPQDGSSPVEEQILGNILEDRFDMIEKKWMGLVDHEKHKANISFLR